MMKRSIMNISGSRLKLIACMSMLIDHTAAHVFKGMDWAHSCLFQIGNHEITPYFILRGVIGRWAFPLFAFLIVEGFCILLIGNDMG